MRFIGRGEPMPHPEWPKIITHITQNSATPNLTMYTNGTMLNYDNINALAQIPYGRL